MAIAFLTSDFVVSTLFIYILVKDNLMICRVYRIADPKLRSKGGICLLIFISLVNWLTICNKLSISFLQAVSLHSWRVNGVNMMCNDVFNYSMLILSQYNFLFFANFWAMTILFQIYVLINNKG